MRQIVLLIVSLVLTTTVIAQDACTALITQVQETVSSACEHTQRNQLCYGNNQLTVTTISEVIPQFGVPGDIVPVSDVRSIQTGAYTEPDEWGLALMRVQANLPDTLPGQNVTFLLFGAVDLESAQDNSPVLAAQALNDINVRARPSTNAAIAGYLSAFTTIDLIGQNSDGSWVYITGADVNGWVYAPLLTIEGDPGVLTQRGNNFTMSRYQNPMQAIYLTSGIGRTDCHDIPADGVLIQTPESDETIELSINGVAILLGSTIYVSAQADGYLSLYVIEGQAVVSAFDESVVVPEGSFTRVLLDSEAIAISPPEYPAPYDTDSLASLPLSLLPESISIAEPATVTLIDSENACQLDISQSLNVRGGPGTNYPVASQLDAGDSVSAHAQYQATDGFIWWNISDTGNHWLRSDLVEASSHCATLPEADTIPIVPTAIPVSSGSQPQTTGQSTTSSEYIDLNLNWNVARSCTPGVISSSATIEINFGMGYPTEGEARAAMDSGSSTITINGQSVPVQRTYTVAENNPPEARYGYQTFYIWTNPAPGDYTIVGTAQAGPQTCQITITG